jgi:hypothetical protein
MKVSSFKRLSYALLGIALSAFASTASGQETLPGPPSDTIVVDAHNKDGWPVAFEGPYEHEVASAIRARLTPVSDKVHGIVKVLFKAKRKGSTHDMFVSEPSMSPRFDSSVVTAIRAAEAAGALRPRGKSPKQWFMSVSVGQTYQMLLMWRGARRNDSLRMVEAREDSIRAERAAEERENAERQRAAMAQALREDSLRRSVSKPTQRRLPERRQCVLANGRAAPGYALLLANIWPGQRLYRTTSCDYVADVIDVDDNGDVVLRTAADGDVLTLPRRLVQARFVTDRR